MKKFFFLIWQIPRKTVAGLVFIYQKTLSPDHSFWAKAVFPHGYCPFKPTCSQYMRDALGKYGLVRGAGKGIYRIFRCHPWTKGGVDLP